MLEILLLPVLGGRDIYFRYYATSGENPCSIEQIDLENMGIAVGSCSVNVLELDKTMRR